MTENSHIVILNSYIENVTSPKSKQGFFIEGSSSIRLENNLLMNIYPSALFILESSIQMNNVTLEIKSFSLSEMICVKTMIIIQNGIIAQLKNSSFIGNFACFMELILILKIALKVLKLNRIIFLKVLLLRILYFITHYQV